MGAWRTAVQRQTSGAAAGAGAALSLDPLSVWTGSGEAVIVLRCKDEAELDALTQAAAASDLNTHVVSDAGRTEVAAGTQTVLAIGPDWVSRIDPVTRHLKLLR